MTTITPRIVTVNTQVQQAPQASQLQQTGAIVSCGATTLAVNTSQYVSSLSAGQALLAPVGTLSTLSAASGVVTATVSGSVGLSVGQTFVTTISNAVPTAFNGTFMATVTTGTEFTVSNVAATGTATVAGNWTQPSVQPVNAALTTFFAQGTAVGVTLVELGPATTWTASVADLSTFIAADVGGVQTIYAYLPPPDMDTGANAALGSLASSYGSPSSGVYFIPTTTQANLTAYASAKSVIAVIPSAGEQPTELQAAAVLYDWVENNPGPASALAPMAYRFLFGVTPWVQTGNSAPINAALTDFANLVLTGAEGGITNACLFRGTTLDGNQASAWYGVDWFRIQVHELLANAIINGSNTTNPLLYDQAGINTLLAIAQSVASDAIAFGCLESAVVTAVPFQTYVTENPANYASGIYNGLAATVTFQNGFLSITFNLDAVTFA